MAWDWDNLTELEERALAAVRGVANELLIINDGRPDPEEVRDLTEAAGEEPAAYPSLYLKTTVWLKPWKAALGSGSYFLRERDGHLTVQLLEQWRPTEGDPLAEAWAGMDTEGKAFWMRPLEVEAYRERPAHEVTVEDVAVWAAVEAAEEAGEPDLAAAIEDSLYGTAEPFVLAFGDLEADREEEPLPPAPSFSVRNMRDQGTSKLARTLAGDNQMELFKEDGERRPLSLDSKGRQTMDVSLSWVNDAVDTSRKLTERDNSIMSGVATCMIEGNTQEFTVWQLLRAMGYSTHNQKTADRLIDDLQALQDVRARAIMPDGSKVEGRLVIWDMQDRRASNGKTVKVLYFYRLPFTYRVQEILAEIQGRKPQIQTYPARYLKGSKSDWDQILRRVVCELVASLNDPNNVNRENVLRITRDPKNPNRPIEIERCGLDIASNTDAARKNRQRVLEVVTDLLDRMEADGTIIGYRVETEGTGSRRTRAKVVIDTEARERRAAQRRDNENRNELRAIEREKRLERERAKRGETDSRNA